MDFIIYYNEILLPYLQMVIDLYYTNSISYQNALQLGASLCDVDKCIYKNTNIAYDMLENALYKFENDVKQLRERLNRVM